MKTPEWIEQHWRCLEISLDESLSPEESLRFEEFLAGNGEAKRRFMEEIQLQAEIRLLMRSQRQIEIVRERMQSAQAVPPLTIGPPLSIGPSSTIGQADGIANPANSSATLLLSSLRNLLFQGTSAMPRAAAALLLVIGGLVGALAVAAVPTWRIVEQPNVDSVVALMTSFEGARWTDASDLSSDRNSLRPGQQLELTAGSAQSTFGFGATILVQGPASFTPLSKKMVECYSGKVTVDSPRAAHGFTVMTPNMEVVDIETPFGNRTKFWLDVAPHTTSLQVFEGEVCVWIRGSIDETSHASGAGIRVLAGEGLAFDAATSTVKQIASDATVFMPSPSEQESDLAISDDYVSAIKVAKPIAYWRFEQATSNSFVNNEMPTRLPLRICGDARIEEQSGNGRAVFVHGDRECWLKTDDAIKAFAGDYSLELWMKASSYHNGALLSLTPRADDRRTASVAALVELIGPDHVTFPAGGIRYLNREPAGEAGGSNVLSDQRYLPKQWHYVVATKAAAQMSLYLDGKLVGADTDPRRISIDPRLVLGRLHAETDLPISRPFVGQLDEVAVYDRALIAKEVENHYALGSAR